MTTMTQKSIDIKTGDDTIKEDANKRQRSANVKRTTDGDNSSNNSSGGNNDEVAAMMASTMMAIHRRTQQ